MKDTAIVVTGASYDGIGGATVRLFSQLGASVIAIDRDKDGPEQLADEYENVIAVHADISRPELTDQLDGILKKQGARLQVLMNNAGIGGGSHALNTTDDDLRNYLDINLVAAFRLSKWAIGHMLKNEPTVYDLKGSIVNVSSVFGLVGAENSAAYSTSKAALSGMTTQMATDYGPSGIRINAVAPGLILTPLTASRIQNQPWRSQIMVDQAPLRRLGTPEDIAFAIRFLASDEAAYITGLTLPVDGGWINGRFPREHPLE
ncbi:SDR family NAD(P)-dependent oxidoreductase [Brucellaceae bacterium C25G]